MSGSRALGRRLVVTLAAAGILLLIAGCVGLPTGGNVNAHEIDTTTDDSVILSLAPGPQDGASPSEIVAGFIRAGRSPQDSYGVAREFLTDNFRAKWTPNASVSVSDTTISPVAADADTYTVSIAVSARINANGNYTQLPAAELEQPSYDLEQNADGEWRISNAPDGTIISTLRFGDTFASYALYYFDPTGDYLVPDLRWFPRITSTKDRIVTELLTGQSPWLGSGVLVTAFPEGTEPGDPVQIDSGVASVDLTSQVLTQSDSAQRRMQDQLTASLDALSQVSSVQMTVGGIPVDVAGSGSQPKRVQTVSSNPLGMSSGKFGFVSGDNVVGVPGISSKVEALAPLGVSLGRDRGAAAVLTAAGASLVTSGNDDPALVDPRPGLVTPTLDVAGYLWSTPAVPSNDPSAGLLAIEPNGTAHFVALPLAAGSRIVSLDVARDGSRLLVAANTPEGPVLLAMGIIRDSKLVPTGLGVPLAVPIRSGPIVDATWLDGVQVAVIQQVEDSNAIDVYQLGGQRAELGILAGSIALAGGNDATELRVLGPDGVLFRATGNQGWQATSAIVSLLGTQQ